MSEIDVAALRERLAERDELSDDGAWLAETANEVLNALPTLLDAVEELAALKASSPAVIVHIPADQPIPQGYHVFGNARLYIVDESAPNDRVYEVTTRSPPELFAEIIRDGETIGSQHDSRHEAIANRIIAGIEGQPRFGVIDGDA